MVTMGVFLFQGKTHMVQPGIEPGTSWLVVRSSDHQATRLVVYIYIYIAYSKLTFYLWNLEISHTNPSVIFFWRFSVSRRIVVHRPNIIVLLVFVTVKWSTLVLCLLSETYWIDVNTRGK